MLVDGFDDIWVGIEALAVVLPEVARGQQQAAVLGEQIPELPQARQQVCDLQANLLQAPDPGAERQTQPVGPEPWERGTAGTCTFLLLTLLLLLTLPTFN